MSVISGEAPKERTVLVDAASQYGVPELVTKKAAASVVDFDSGQALKGKNVLGLTIGGMGPYAQCSAAIGDVAMVGIVYPGDVLGKGVCRRVRVGAGDEEADEVGAKARLANQRTAAFFYTPADELGVLLVAHVSNVSRTGDNVQMEHG